jgi:hypothetical protein
MTAGSRSSGPGRELAGSDVTDTLATECTGCKGVDDDLDIYPNSFNRTYGIRNTLRVPRSAPGLGVEMQREPGDLRRCRRDIDKLHATVSVSRSSSYLGGTKQLATRYRVVAAQSETSRARRPPS